MGGVPEAEVFASMLQQQEGANREKVAVHTLLEGLQEANRQVRLNFTKHT